MEAPIQARDQLQVPRVAHLSRHDTRTRVSSTRSGKHIPRPWPIMTPLRKQANSAGVVLSRCTPGWRRRRGPLGKIASLGPRYPPPPPPPDAATHGRGRDAASTHAGEGWGAVAVASRVVERLGRRRVRAGKGVVLARGVERRSLLPWGEAWSLPKKRIRLMRSEQRQPARVGRPGCKRA